MRSASGEVKGIALNPGSAMIRRYPGSPKASRILTARIGRSGSARAGSPPGAIQPASWRQRSPVVPTARTMSGSRSPRTNTYPSDAMRCRRAIESPARFPESSNSAAVVAAITTL